ncbi:response regulator transcription factor [Marinomonas sp. 2405UD68-3]|uniref:response regulator transcription factor n=1 Tax=Marinomonas sp. 2405UD68-3 TaxID=3391835 RepID=UPI0039C90F7B
MKILCWNTNESVWAHWLKVAPSENTLLRVLSLDELKALIEVNNSEQIEYCFIYLSDQDFSAMVEYSVDIRREFPNLKIIVFPNRPSQSAALRMLSQGINGQCSPYIGAKQLKMVLSVIDMGEIWSGKAFINNLIAANPMQADTDEIESEDSLNTLSKKEIEVAFHIAKGLNNKQIASEMLISDRTVKSHITNIFRKTNTKDRLGLALLVQKSNSTH